MTTTWCPVTGRELVDTPDPITAAERAVVEAAVARYLGAQHVVPKLDFMLACIAFEDACRELLRHRAAQGTT